MVMKSLLGSFHLRLAPHDEKWFLGGWQSFDGESSVFSEALNPEETLATGVNVCGGLMLPDTFPILGDGLGNHLCARFGTDGTLSEIVAWDHEGGNWRHYGYSIDQALALSQMEYALTEEQEDEEIRPLVGISPVALSEMKCKRGLESRLEAECRVRGGQKIARRIGVDWKEFAKWLRDTSLIPQERADQLAEALHIKQSELLSQNWAEAVEQAKLVIDVRSDLAWPYAVIGWACERKGRSVEAIEYYKRGLMTLGTSSAFTETWTHDREVCSQKFAAQRLRTLSNLASEPEVQGYIAARTVSETRNFWLVKAKVSIESHDHRSAYRYFYFAGWDSPFSNEVQDVVSAVQSSAQKAGFSALAALALLHLKSS